MFFFFFNDTATTEIYTLSLHDALPILAEVVLVRRRLALLVRRVGRRRLRRGAGRVCRGVAAQDWKSTRLNSSHANISYAVFCLKKKNTSKLQLFLYILICLLHSPLNSS